MFPHARCARCPRRGRAGRLGRPGATEMFPHARCAPADRMMPEPLGFAALRGTLLHDAPLARHTTWRVGGNADLLYTPADRDDLAQFLRDLPAAMPVTTLGLGSNVLVRDGGVRG